MPCCVSEVGAPLAMLARGAQPPPIQLIYYGAAPLHQGEAHRSNYRPRAPHAHPSTLLLTTFVLALGESFDIACFGGMTGYQATRVEGGLAATVLS